MDKLTNVKVNLRGLLISCPSGMTIKELENDYKEIIGENIPFYNFGFNRLDLFLKSLKDTLTIFGSGPYAKVEAVTVKSNAHIKKMVSVQKKTKKRKFAIVNPYKQINIENRPPLKKVVNPPSQQFVRPMQSKPQLQPLMTPNPPKAPKQILKNQNQFDQNIFNNQRAAPQFTNVHQRNPNFQNGYQQFVPQQQYMNPQQYYEQQHDMFLRQQHGLRQHVLSSQMQQGFHNLNTVELMRMRQMIQSELFYLRIQHETNYYHMGPVVNRNFF